MVAIKGMPGKSCLVDCTCGRHTSRTEDVKRRIGKPQRGVSKPSNPCKDGCMCRKHVGYSLKCEIGCTCGRHEREVTWWTGTKCLEGCNCRRHSNSGNHIGIGVPNKTEIYLESIISDFGFSFVGDGKLIVRNKCPDFWDGGTKLIEMFGDYWHRGEDPQPRIDLFKVEGYDCLVIWEHELKNPENVLERVSRFMKAS